jgi:hypothetical protein
LSFLALIRSDQTTEALFIRACIGNVTLYAYYRERSKCDHLDHLLTGWERLAIWMYTAMGGRWYRDVNDPLREGRANDDTKALAHILTTGLQKLPRHAGLVYRGIRVENLASFLRGYAVGTDVQWPAFSSSSIEGDKALIGNVLFIVRSNNGRVVGPYADIQDEREVVFLPGSRFRVDGVEQTPTKAIIDLSELPLSTTREGEAP